MKPRMFMFLLMPVLANGLIEEDIMPRMLDDCYSSQLNTVLSKTEIQTNCLSTFLSYMYRNNSLPKLDPISLEWVNSLGRRIHRRLKRQGGRYSHRARRRQEIRTLTESQRENLFAAFNALKRDRTKPPNKFDIIAMVHDGDAIGGAHNGPAFVSWHRYYLMLMEEALRTKKRSVVLPYWDSRLDYRMTKPEETILLSELFWGNGQGVVFTGPFAFWVTPAQNTLLRRDVPGPRSSLINPDTIKQVLNKKYHRQILTPTSARDEDNLERHHDGVHRWVGGRDGHMGGLDTSPQEPIFWFHHCFVDYLWEEFRIGQQRQGVDSGKDYPPTTIPHQGPNDVMVGLGPPKTNIEAYKNSFIRNVYRYVDAPTCQNKCGGANSAYLYCDQRKNACVSRARREFDNYSDKSRLKYWNRSPGTGTPSKMVSEDAASETSPATALSPSVSQAFTARPSPLRTNSFRASIIDSRTPQARRRRSIDSPKHPNNLNGKSISLLSKGDADKTWNNDITRYFPDNWVLTPVEIINNHDTSHLNVVHTNAPLDPTTDILPRFNITLQTDGFSYNGRYTDYITIDERSRLSESVSLIAIKKPDHIESKAYVRVYDSYGGVCEPSCRTADGTYQRCSGVVKVTTDYPLMYEDFREYNTRTDIRPFFRFICHN